MTTTTSAFLPRLRRSSGRRAIPLLASTFLAVLTLTSCEQEVELSASATFGVTNLTSAPIKVKWNGHRDRSEIIDPGFFYPLETLRDHRNGPAPSVDRNPLWCLHVQTSSGRTLYRSSNIDYRRFVADPQRSGAVFYGYPIDAEFLATAEDDFCM